MLITAWGEEGWRHQEEQQKEACSEKNYAVLVALNREVYIPGMKRELAARLSGTMSASHHTPARAPLAGWLHLSLWPVGGAPNTSCTRISLSP